MKTLRFIIIAFLSVLGFVASAQAPFYVYQKEGKINAFYSNEIDSIVLSKTDELGIVQPDFVVQEYHAMDSIYRIPIASIDSVSFVTPKTVYRDNVVTLEGDIRKYIKRAEELKLYFNSDIPVTLLPQIGQKIVSTIGDEYLESAFMGEVSALNTIDREICIECIPVSATDVFEVYYGIIQQYESPLKSRSIIDGTYSTPFEFNPGPFKLDLLRDFPGVIQYSPNDDLAYSVEDALMNFEISPSFRISVFTIINPKIDFYQSLTIIGDYEITENARLSGGISASKDIWESEPLKKAFPQALIDIYLKMGITLDFGVEASMAFSATQKYRSVFHWEKSARGLKVGRNENQFFPVSSTYEGEFALNGDVSLSFYIEPGVEFIFDNDLDIAQINFLSKNGIKLSGQYLATKADVETSKHTPWLYNQLKNKKVSLSRFYSMDVEAHFFKWTSSHELNLPNLKLNGEIPWFTINSVPLFKETKFLSDGYPFKCQSIAYGNCPKTQIGFSLIPKDEGERIDTYITTHGGVSLKDDIETPITSQFDAADSHCEYSLYTLINYMGNDLLADYIDDRFVDLGLSVLWAKYNVGAEEISDFGNYYRWDDSFEGVASYDECALLPSLNNWEELRDRCVWEWTNIDGHYGYLVTGPNQNSIFLPASGVFVEVEGGIWEGVNDMGRFWSSDKKSEQRAYDFIIWQNSYHTDDDDISGHYSVRAIKPL